MGNFVTESSHGVDRENVKELMVGIGEYGDVKIRKDRNGASYQEKSEPH
jgi:hypothetical protein